MENDNEKLKISDEKGLSTIEMLVAMTLMIISISATLPLVAGSQSVSIDLETNQEALYKAGALLQEARATALSDYNAVITTSWQSDGIYQKQTHVIYESIAQCSKDVKSNVVWTSNNRTIGVELITRLGDVANAKALGGNCDASPPLLSGWNSPKTFVSSSFNSGGPTGLDALNGIVYMTGNGNPIGTENFYVADTSGAIEGTSGGLFVDFNNGFESGARLNDIKVGRLSDGNIYAFVARDTKKNQFQVIDVTDIYNPVSAGIFPLENVDENGSYPQAWRVYYYNNKVYITTRYTAGPELHIFDVSNPSNIYEIGGGIELGLTVNGFVITEKIIGGVFYRFAYMATSSDVKELFVLDLANLFLVAEITGASRNLVNPDYADGNAVFLIGNNLYFGRDSGNPDDLYIFDVANPLIATGGLPILRTADIGASVIGLVVSGQYIFIVTKKVNNEFLVWTSDPSKPITKVSTAGYQFPNIIGSIKYENNRVYIASQTSDTLRILSNDTH